MLMALIGYTVAAILTIYAVHQFLIWLITDTTFMERYQPPYLIRAGLALGLALATLAATWE